MASAATAHGGHMATGTAVGGSMTDRTLFPTTSLSAGLRPGDLIRLRKTDYLIRDYGTREDGSLCGFFTTWRDERGKLKTSLVRCDCVDELGVLLARDQPLRATREDDWHQTHIENGFRNAGPQPGYIYFLAGERLCKIGFTTDVEQRVRYIRVLCETQLTLLGTIKGTIPEEKQIHARFAHLRQHGEWFTLCDEILDFIRKEAP